jgi:hypothetical protein
MTAPGVAPRTAATPVEQPDAARHPAGDRQPARLATGTTPEPAAVEPADVGPAPDPVMSRDATPRRDVTLASSGGMAPQATTLEEAAEYLRGAEATYLQALTRYAELASQAETGDPIARLAALQSIILTTQAALNETPTDPVINGYHLTALAQRDATLRQVALASSEQWY